MRVSKKKKRTLQQNRRHQNSRDDNKQVILDLAPCALPEIRLACQKHVLQTIHILSPCRRVHLSQNFSQWRCDVLSTALLKNIDESAVEELPGWVVLRETARIDVVGNIVDFGVVDTPYPAN